MDLSIPKCAITRCPNKSHLTPTTSKAFTQAHNITYQTQKLPVLTQNKPYKYLGIQLVPSLKWNLQKEISIKKLKNQSLHLIKSPATLRQKIKIVNTVLRPGVAYSFHAVPYSMSDIKKLDKLLISTTKIICKLPRSTPNLTTQPSHNLFAMTAFSFTIDYLKCIGEQL